MEKYMEGKLIDLALTLSATFIIGFATGYFIKKFSKIIILLFGIIIIIFVLFENGNIISIHDTKLISTMEVGINYFQGLLVTIKEKILKFSASGIGSLITGFLVGFKVG